MLRQFILTAAALALTSALATPTLAADAVPDYVTAAINDAARPAADKERDADRKPAEMLMFAGVKPGSKVVEIMPAGGYFTRLFAKAVGPTGHVYLINPGPPPADAPQQMKDRMAGMMKGLEDMAKTYGNITLINEGFADFKVPAQADIAWTSQNYHDFHIARFNTDITKFNKSVFNALKPGGVFVVLDHTAAEGAGLAVAETLHRMDEAILKQEMAAAGFTPAGESNALRNPADPRTAGVFDPSVRGKTDQFVLAFKKPAK